MKKLFARKPEYSRNDFRSIHTLLLTQGLVKTLDYLCTFSVFSVLSEA